MNPETIRAIDIGVGRAACLALTAARRIRDAMARRDRAPTPVRKILFLKLIEQGATVLAYSALERAASMVGRENIYFCVFEENRPILDILDMVPPENIFSIRHRTFGVFLRDVWNMLVKARRLRIDATVDMEFFARASAILSFLTGASRRVGLHRFTSEAPYRGDLLTHRVQYNPYLHTAKFYHLLVAALELDPGDVPLVKLDIGTLRESVPVFVPTAKEEKRIQTLLEDEFPGGETGPLVLLNPNAGDMLPLRKWPTERFVELGRMILERHPQARVAITGAPSERREAEEVAARIGGSRAASLAGKTTLRELLALYVQADVLVTNDSGPGHFASLTPIHGIVMYGPETPDLFGAIGGNGETVRAPLACSPCVNVFNHRFSPCRNNLCMQSISVGEVYDRVAAALAKRTRRVKRAERAEREDPEPGRS
ncbi:MAG: glycosyltransferase family 9 protein [Pseudomonadota bacterium]|nr:glycosyltransferase family 9 protein [Pseudomonadota bacterium]